jgi:predicted O-methyltransferase YrrM
VAAGRDRAAARRLAAEVRYGARLRALPPRVALFYWRARRVAVRVGDEFSLGSATRPADLAQLLQLARGRHRVVELGTATAWTAIALAITDPARQITSFDPVEHRVRERYLSLVGAGARSRIELVSAPGAGGPRDQRPVELLYVDSSHERQDTIDELRAWGPVLAEGALVVLDDYDHPEYPGVREAVRELGLSGEQRGTLFVHEATGGRG